VLDVVGAAARDALDAGWAQLELSTVEELYGPGADYDTLAVVLSPRYPQAARVVVEIQDRGEWWLTAGDGPGVELHAGMREDRFAALTDLVRAVVAGRYGHGWEQRRRRMLLRPWRHRVDDVWVARIAPHRSVAEQWGSQRHGAPLGTVRFAPYASRDTSPAA